MLAFQYILSYKRSRSVRGPVMVSSQSAHGQLTLRFSSGKVFACFNEFVHISRHGQLRVRSLSAHGPITVSS